MKSQSDCIDYLWKTGWFKKFRKPKEIADKIYEDFGIFCINITPVLKLNRFKKHIRKFKQGWKEIRAASPQNLKKDSSFNEVKKVLGHTFKKETEELEIVMNSCSDCTAFVMRKILEKLLFIIISKSDKKQKLREIKNKEGKLPNLTQLLNIAKVAEINDLHIISPKSISNLQGIKFLGDTSAHDYLTNVGFEDIKQELAHWRIAVKQLASNL